MKKFFIFFIGMWALLVQAQQLPDGQEEKLVSLEVKAPLAESFMGRTFHFSYWEVFAVNAYLPNPVLTLDPSWGYRPNKNGVPNIHATYAIRRGITPSTPLGSEDELMDFSTEISEPTPNSRTKVISCADSVVSYAVAEGEDLIMIVVTKHAPQGNIIFSGILQRNPKKSVEVDTKQVTTDLGTFVHKRETVKFDTKNIEKEAVKYARAMCQKTFPEWLKNVPTAEEIRNQAGEQPQKAVATIAKQKSIVPNKKVAVPAKTVVPKLQSAQPTYRSGK